MLLRREATNHRHVTAAACLARHDGTATASGLGRYVDVDTSACAAHIYLLVLSASRRQSRRSHLRPAGKRRLHRGIPALAEGSSLSTEWSDGVPGHGSPPGVTSVCGLDCLLHGRSALCHAEIRRHCLSPAWGAGALKSFVVGCAAATDFRSHFHMPRSVLSRKEVYCLLSCGHGNGYLKRFFYTAA